MKPWTKVVLLAFVALGVARSVAAEVHAVEVTLFLPCNRETAQEAISALRDVAGVEEVLAAEGDLRVRVITGVHFVDDPLTLVQVLWDMKLYPNRIYIEATGVRLAASTSDWIRLVGSDQVFAVKDMDRFDSVDEPVRFRAEVLDWIEDRPARPSAPYTLRVLETKS